MEMHLFLDETYEKFLTDAEITNKIFSEAQSKIVSMHPFKRFKFSDLKIDEKETGL